MRNDISQITTTGPYVKIFIPHCKVAALFPRQSQEFYLLSRRWIAGENLLFQLITKETVARCQITRYRWPIVITISKDNFFRKKSIISLLVCATQALLALGLCKIRCIEVCGITNSKKQPQEKNLDFRQLILLQQQFCRLFLSDVYGFYFSYNNLSQKLEFFQQILYSDPTM